MSLSVAIYQLLMGKSGDEHTRQITGGTLASMMSIENPETFNELHQLKVRIVYVEAMSSAEKLSSKVCAIWSSIFEEDALLMPLLV